MTIKTIIVDNEYQDRQELRRLLEMEGIEILGEAENAEEAQKLISSTKCTVIFLDIHIPGMSGLELGKILMAQPQPPYIIFVTALEEHAVQAFEVNAVDYLVKPVNKQRLQQALDKLFLLIEGNQKFLKNESKIPAPVTIDRIPVEKQGKTLLIPPEEIIYAYIMKNNVYVKTFQNTYLTRFPLKELQKRLNTKNFFRTHRCYIVNLNKVEEIIPFFNGTFTLVVGDIKHSEVPVSRNQTRKLKRLLGL